MFGSSLVAPGDLDGDGTPDLLVGAGGDDDGGPDRGAGLAPVPRPRRHRPRTPEASARPRAAPSARSPMATSGPRGPSSATSTATAARTWSGARGWRMPAARTGARRASCSPGYAVPAEAPPGQRALRLEAPAPNPARGTRRDPVPGSSRHRRPRRPRRARPARGDPRRVPARRRPRRGRRVGLGGGGLLGAPPVRRRGGDAGADRGPVGVPPSPTGKEARRARR